ncbi:MULTISPECIES: HAMP domain-containing protein [Streptomyces]|uniref:HAMP domain-containing protein n=1 Tax=Streptomyces TaxID=1883 RepID=UPI00131D7464|nr:HAMP domain-containing protein [Streptomyces virginiae]
MSLAVFAAWGLFRFDSRDISPSALTSERYVAQDSALAFTSSINGSAADLNDVTTAFSRGNPVQPDAVLDHMVTTYHGWRGVGIVDAGSGRLIAQRGENLPLQSLSQPQESRTAGPVTSVVRLATGEARLLSYSVLTWPNHAQWLVITSGTVRLPRSETDTHAMALLDSKGAVIASEGFERVKGFDVQQQFASRGQAIAARAGQRVQSGEAAKGRFRGASGSIPGDPKDSRHFLIGYASLSGAPEGSTAASMALTIATVAEAAQEPQDAVDAAASSRLITGGGLLGLGLLTAGLLLIGIQRPLLRLFIQSRRISQGDLARRVSVPKSGEAARLGRALEQLRLQLLGRAADGEQSRSLRHRRRGIGMRSLLLCAAAILVLWSAPLLLILNHVGDSAAIPQAVVNGQQDRTNSLADRIRRSLSEDRADLSAAARQMNNKTSGQEMQNILDAALARHPYYRSLHVQDAQGKVVAKAGESDRLRTAGGQGSGELEIIERNNRPAIVETVAVEGIPDARIVGELHIDFLNALLKRPGLGQVRLVDDRLRVIGSNAGYLAFEKLPNRDLDGLATVVGRPTELRAKSAIQRSGDRVSIAAAAPVSISSTKPLNWTVVSWQPADELDIPEYRLQNRTVLAGLLGLTVVAGCLGWVHIVVVRPLRQLASHAENLAAGDRRTVLYPVHHDEVGAITRSLELIRQQLQAQDQSMRVAVDSPEQLVQAAPAGRN